MFKATLRLPAELSTLDTAILGESLSDLCTAHSALREEKNDNSPWILEWLFPEQAQTQILKARLVLASDAHDIEIPQDLKIVQEDVPDINWLEHSYMQFPPFSIGPFFIYGSHYDGDVPDGQMGLQIDAATAFGSGEHGTTKGCLQMMLDLKGQGACPWNVLDMGTGSGILAIAAWKLWKTPVLGVDNDEEAVRVSKRHHESNAIPQSPSDLTFRCGDGFSEETVQKRKPFDLIIANILPGPLKDMAHDLFSCADDNGYVILSGILNEQAQGVLDVYRAAGLAHRKTIRNDEWSSLLLQKPAV